MTTLAFSAPDQFYNVPHLVRLQELLESEKMYVSDLEQVYTYITYMRESKEKEEADIPMPDDLREGRDRMIFGNLENIYEWHRE